MKIPAEAQKTSSRYAPLNRPARVEPDFDFGDGFSPSRMRFSGGDERYTLALASRVRGDVVSREEATRALDNTSQDLNPQAGEVQTATARLNAQGFSCQEGDFSWTRLGSTYSSFSPQQAAVATYTADGVSLDQYSW